MKYIPQIDTLRFICAFIVIFRHLPIIPEGTFISTIFMYVTGVDVFFVLSGFLISLILLERSEIAVKPTLIRFYVRRILRIFPIYYLSILVLILVNPAEYRNYAIYDILYLSNFKMGFDGDFSTVTPHFWSLAVEEQFYLFWPFLLLIVFRRKQFLFLCMTTFIGICSYLFFYVSDNTFFGARTFNNIAYLSGGGILAWIYLNKNYLYQNFLKTGSLVFLIVFIGLGFLCFFADYRYSTISGQLVSFLFSICIVQFFSCEIKGILRRVVMFKPFLMLGKVSYGMYLYHLLMIIPFTMLVNLFNLETLFSNYPYLTNGAKIMLTILFAFGSWYILEKPVLKFKENFKY